MTSNFSDVMLTLQQMSWQYGAGRAATVSQYPDTIWLRGLWQENCLITVNGTDSFNGSLAWINRLGVEPVPLRRKLIHFVGWTGAQHIAVNSYILTDGKIIGSDVFKYIRGFVIKLSKQAWNRYAGRGNITLFYSEYDQRNRDFNFKTPVLSYPSNAIVQMDRFLYWSQELYAILEQADTSEGRLSYPSMRLDIYLDLKYLGQAYPGTSPYSYSFTEQRVRLYTSSKLFSDLLQSGSISTLISEGAGFNKLGITNALTSGRTGRGLGWGASGNFAGISTHGESFSEEDIQTMEARQFLPLR